MEIAKSLSANKFMAIRKRTVDRFVFGVERRDMRAIRHENKYSARTRGIDPPVRVDGQPVGQTLLALFEFLRAILKHPAIGKGAVVGDVEAIHMARSGSELATYNVRSSGDKPMPLGRLISRVSSCSLPSVVRRYTP